MPAQNFDKLPRAGRSGRAGLPPEGAERGGPKPESAVGKIVEGVRFERISNKDGEFQGFKSSAFGRKRVVLRDGQGLPFSERDRRAYTRREFKVKVLEDSNPEDPEQGVYTVEVLREKDGLEHREAQLERVKQLRNSRGFEVLARLLHHPDFSAEYKPVAKRHKEFHLRKTLPRDLDEERGTIGYYGEEDEPARGKGKHSDEAMESRERHRNLTGMLAGLMTSKRAGPLLEKIIDRTVSADSMQIKERIDSMGRPFTPQVVVGAGIYAGIMASTRAMYLTNSPGLTLEEEKKIGGQFAQYDRSLFKLNSRNRPELPDEPHLPGTKQSLNTLAEFGVMQPSDMGGESYASQDTVARTARMNLFLSGEVATEARVSKVRRNFDKSRNQSGALVVEFIDTKTNKILEVGTEVVTFTTGIGKERTGLDMSDVQTADIIRDEKEKLGKIQETRALLNNPDVPDEVKKDLSHYDTPRVFSFQEFTRMVADKENPFPLQGKKKIVLSGKGDSANVIAGILLGYEGQQGKTITQLDNVEEIIWVGQPIESKEEWLEKIRARYIQLGLEFPRNEYENYYHRITPVTDVRASRLVRTEDGIRVLLSKENERTEAEDLRYVEGDIFIYAHGFEDETDDVVRFADARANISPENVRKELSALRQAVFEGLPRDKTDIYYKEGNIARVEILQVGRGRNNNPVTLRVLYRDKSFEELTISGREFVNSAYCVEGNIERIEVAEGVPELYSVREEIDGSTRAIAKEYAVSSGRIYKAGPASGLELTEEEKREAPALERINENTAAIFRYAQYVQKLAEGIATSTTRPTRGFLTKERRRKETLPKFGLFKREKIIETVVAIDRDQADKVGPEENTEDLLRLGVGDVCAGFVFPNNMPEITITAERIYSYGLETQFIFSISPSLPGEYRNFIDSLTKDSLVGGVLNKVADNARKKPIRITLPFSEGKLDVENVSYAIERN